MVLPWETYMISRYCVYVSRRQIARGALPNFAPNGELVIIIADFITYSTSIHICIAAWMKILFVLYLNLWDEATRSWRYWNECRNHELELENKRLCIELTLREAETLPPATKHCSFVIRPVVCILSKKMMRKLQHILYGLQKLINRDRGEPYRRRRDVSEMSQGREAVCVRAVTTRAGNGPWNNRKIVSDVGMVSIR